MRPALIAIGLFISGVAATIGYFAWQGDCRGGIKVADLAECEAKGETPGFCMLVMREAKTAASRGGPVFTNQNACMDQFPACIPHAGTQGYVPKPVSFCIQKDGRGGIAKLDPVYERAGKRIGN